MTGAFTFAGNLGHAPIIGIGDHVKQLLHAAASYPGDDAEFCQMSTDRVDHC